MKIVIAYEIRMSTGKDAANEGSDLVKRLGKKFMLPLFSKGYHLYVDNWYAGENLARYFLENET